MALEDRPVFETYLARYQPGTCEMSFANIYIWKDTERPRFTLINDNLCVLVEPTFEPSYFLAPLGEEWMEDTLRTCLAHAPRLSRVPEDFVRRYGAPFRAQEREDCYDYIYRAEDLAELKGKKYDGKRNRIRKFESGFAHAYSRLGREHVEGCRHLLERWHDGKGNTDPYIGAQKAAIFEALTVFEPLELKGGVVTVAGRVEAFTIGQRLTDDTALVQIEIANPDMPGLAQYINREFVRHEWRSFAYVNREQDMGFPGLKRAKLSYQPVRLLKKYDLFLA